jgi:hypothetical protein
MKLFRKAMLAVVTFVLALVAFVAPVRHTQADAASTMRVYYTNPSNWTTVKAYGWNGSFAPSWPGKNMTKDDVTGYWYIDGITPGQSIIFNNGSGSQTGDLKVPTDGACVSNGLSWTNLDEAPEEIKTITVYYTNPKKWTNVKAYGWNCTVGLQGGWPGSAMKLDSATGYYYINGVEPGQKIIFNGSGGQTSDLTVPTDGANVYNGTAWVVLGGGEVEPEEPEVPEVGSLDLGMIGSFNGWAANIKLTWNAEKERYEVEHVFKDGDQWKIRFGTSWDGALGWHGEDLDASTKKYCVEGKDGTALNGNICIKTGSAGKYLVWVDSTAKHIGMEPVWELAVKVGFQVGTKDEAKALRLVAEFNLDEARLETFDSEIQFRVTKGTKADTREVTRLYSSVNPMNDEAELTGAYYAVLTYVNIPAGEYLVEVLVDGVVAATVTATVA